MRIVRKQAFIFVKNLKKKTMLKVNVFFAFSLCGNTYFVRTCLQRQERTM